MNAMPSHRSTKGASVPWSFRTVLQLPSLLDDRKIPTEDVFVKLEWSDGHVVHKIWRQGTTWQWGYPLFVLQSVQRRLIARRQVRHPPRLRFACESSPRWISVSARIARCSTSSTCRVLRRHRFWAASDIALGSWPPTQCATSPRRKASNVEIQFVS